MARNLKVMVIIAWNVYIGNHPTMVRAELKRMIHFRNPKVIVLMEATRMRGHLGGLGYQVVQLKPRPKKKGNTPGDANIAILVRNDIPIKQRKTLRMTKFWRGPVHGWRQDPRVYRWVKLDFGGRIWKIGGAHTPFGRAARNESRKKLVHWGKMTARRRPTVLVLDANMHLQSFRKTIATPGGMKATGKRIDLVAYKNVRLRRMRDLGHHGSDHPAMLYRFTAR